MVKKILIVDDDESYRYLIKRAITKSGVEHTIVEAENGQVALNTISKWLEHEKYVSCLIFLDINMPVMNGHEFLSKFDSIYNQSRDYFDASVVAMLTSSSSLIDKELVVPYQYVKHYITKPVTLSELKDFLVTNL